MYLLVCVDLTNVTVACVVECVCTGHVLYVLVNVLMLPVTGKVTSDGITISLDHKLSLNAIV